MQVVGRFVLARMEGLKRSAQDVAMNTDLAEEDVTKLVEGNLNFVTLMDNIVAVEEYLDFDLDLQKLLLRLSARELGNQFRAWGRGDKTDLPSSE